MKNSPLRIALSCLAQALWLLIVGSLLVVPYAFLVESRAAWDTWAVLIQLGPITFAFALSVVAFTHVVDVLVK